MTRASILVATVLCCAASPAIAQQTLYCVDNGATGFVWDKDGRVQQGRFEQDRFTVQVLSDSERIITQMSGSGTARGKSRRYTCTRPNVGREVLACDDGFGDYPWLFFQNTFTYAFLSGPPAGGADRNIWISYGTCTGF